MITPRPKVIIFKKDILYLSETFVREQALAMRTWQPVLVGNNLVKTGLPLDGLDVHILAKLRARGLSKYYYHFVHKLGFPLPLYIELIRMINPRLIHAHFGTDAVAIWPYARALKLPFIITLHGYDINTNRSWWEKEQSDPALRDYPRQLLSIAQQSKVHFIAVSEAIRQRAIEYGIPKEKITVSYIGVNVSQFHPSGLPLVQRRKQILFVGRMIENKGPLLLIKAFERLLKAVPDAALVMIGDGPLRSDAEQMAHSLNLQVTFTGAVSSLEVMNQLRDARVFCLPSIRIMNGNAEGLPTVLLEAQACGVPVVTTDCGGCAESMLDGVTGFVCSQGDIDCLASRLECCLTDDSLAENMSRAAERHIRERFDINERTKELEEIYNRHAN